MAIGQNRIIHRFVRPIADYEEGGIYYNQVIPVDTQAYAYYPKESGKDCELWYVFGDGIHTYIELRDGKGLAENAKEFPVFTQEFIDKIDAGPQTYVHIQGIASEMWVIQHNLKKYPSVTVVDSTGMVVIGDIQYDNENQITLIFNGAFKGKAYLN